MMMIGDIDNNNHNDEDVDVVENNNISCVKIGCFHHYNHYHYCHQVHTN
jgi:hypothetical protein